MNTSQTIPLERRTYGVAISWDTTGQKTVDLDLQVVLVDSVGRIVDAIFHNNLNAMNGAVTHSGDQQRASGDNFGELVWVDFTKIKMGIKMMIFIVAAASGGHLIDVRKGLITIIDLKKSVLARYTMESSRGDVDAVVMMKRSKVGRWSCEPVDRLAEEGTSFLDILDVLGSLIKTEIPDAPDRQSAVFITDKGAGQHRKDETQSMRRIVRLEPAPYSSIFSWESETIEAQADVEVLLVNNRGFIVDVVNHLNMFGMDGAVSVVSAASDNDAGGMATQWDHTVQLELEELQDVKLILFLLTVNSSFALNSLHDLSVLFLNEREDHSQARLSIDTTHKTARSRTLLVLSQEDDGAWKMHQLQEEPQLACTVYDALSHLGGIIRDFIPSAPEHSKMLKFEMHIGSVVSIPDKVEFKKVIIDVTGSLKTIKGQVQADNEIRVALVMLDRKGVVLETATLSQVNTAKAHVQFKPPGAAKASAQDCSGCFTVAITGASKQVSQVMIALLLAKEDLSTLRQATCELSDQNGAELASFKMSQLMTHESGVILARLYRQQDRSWTFQACGKLCGGREWSDGPCLQTMQGMVATAPKDYNSKINSLVPSASEEPVGGTGEISLEGGAQLTKNVTGGGAQLSKAASFFRSRSMRSSANLGSLTMEHTTAWNSQLSDGPIEAFVPTSPKAPLILSVGPGHHGRRNGRTKYASRTSDEN